MTGSIYIGILIPDSTLHFGALSNPVAVVAGLGISASAINAVTMKISNPLAIVIVLGIIINFSSHINLYQICQIIYCDFISLPETHLSQGD